MRRAVRTEYFQTALEMSDQGGNDSRLPPRSPERHPGERIGRTLPRSPGAPFMNVQAERYSTCNTNTYRACSSMRVCGLARALGRNTRTMPTWHGYPSGRGVTRDAIPA